MHRFHHANLRAAWWALRTARRTRRRLAAGGLDAALGPPPPPPLPSDAELGVRAALRRRRESCLVNAIVLQAWEAAHGRRRDLVVGVTGPSGFSAHAWLEGDAVPAADDRTVDASALGLSHAAGPPRVADRAIRDARGPNEKPGRAFRELLRRPAPAVPPRRTRVP